MAKLQLSFNLVLGILLLAGCTQATIEPPLPTPTLLMVSHSPSLRNLAIWLNSCAQSEPSLALFMEESVVSNIHLDQADLVIWLGEPPPEAGFSAPLAWEEIVLIVNLANPIRKLNRAEITSLFTGQVSNWEQLGEEPLEINLWIFPQGHEIYRGFKSVFLEGKPVTSLSRVAPSPTAMLQAIAEDEGAVGFLPRSWLDEGVKTISVPDVEREKLLLPIVALAKKEPGGVARNFLACLQSPEGQGTIPEHYEPWNANLHDEP